MFIELPNLRRAVEEDPCFPIYGELIRMLEEDMTVEEAVIEHCSNFGFKRIESDWEHDLCHILLGLAYLKLGYDPLGIPFSYNNNSMAEAIVRQMEKYVNGYIRDRSPKPDFEKYKFGISDIEARSINASDDVVRSIHTSRMRVAVLKDLMQEKGQIGSYFELLVENEDIAKVPTNSEWLKYGRNQDVPIHPVTEQTMRHIFEYTKAPLLYILDKLYTHEKSVGKAFNRAHGVDLAWMKEANSVMGPIKMRALWNLMPVTDHEPVFPFSCKGRMQMPEYELM